MFRHHRSAWVTVVTTSASVHALVMQLYNAEVWWLGKKEIHHLAIQTLVLLVTVLDSNATDRLDRTAEHVVLWTFDDERWRAVFQKRPGTFVRLCGRLVRQNVPFRCPVSVKWHKKRHSDIQFEQAECPNWKLICTNWIWIAFQTTSPCGLDLSCKNQISSVFLLFQLNEVSLYMPKILICLQSEQDLRALTQLKSCVH